MKEGKTVVNSNQGITIEAAEKLSKIAISHSCSAYMRIRTFYVNAKSILGILSAQVKQGEEVEFVCNGEDEDACLEQMIEMIKSLG